MEVIKLPVVDGEFMLFEKLGIRPEQALCIGRVMWNVGGVVGMFALVWSFNEYINEAGDSSTLPAIVLTFSVLIAMFGVVLHDDTANYTKQPWLF